MAPEFYVIAAHQAKKRRKKMAECGCWLCCHALVSPCLTFAEHEAWMAKCLAINEGQTLLALAWGRHKE